MKYVVLGASAAGINAIKILREEDPLADITLISKDDKIYSRCMLHHVISNHRTEESINFVDEDFISKNNINWINNTEVKSIDSINKEVKTNNKVVTYDKLLIATGARAFIPPIKNLREGKNIYCLRDIEDSQRIRDNLSQVKNVVIIGAGLVGIDALSGIMITDYDIEISLIYLEDYILNLQLDEYSAKVYEDKFRNKGIKLYNNSSVNEIKLNERMEVQSVQVGTKDEIECDMVIVSTGILPNIDYINKEEIHCARGVKINDKCETNVKDIYAAGDVTGDTGIWPLAVKQGKVAAYNMVNKERCIEDKFSQKNTMNFEGIATVSIGLVNPIDDSYKVIENKFNNSYKKFIIKDNIIYGFIAQGDISYVGVINYLIKNKIEIDDLENELFNLNYAQFFKIKENGEFEYSFI